MKKSNFQMTVEKSKKLQSQAQAQHYLEIAVFGETATWNEKDAKEP